VWQLGGRHHAAELQAAQRGAAIGETYKLLGYCMGGDFDGLNDAY
jgi:hypothetical protein